MKQIPTTIILWLALTLIVVFSFFFSRSVFVHPLDWEHLADYRAHSQWAIPFSTRSISDNQLYAIAAYTLGQGVHPFLINPEVPPLGKYLYTAAILSTGTPYVSSAVLYLGVLILTFLLGKQLGQKTKYALAATLIVALSPALFMQLTLTMLDLPLMFFLLVHVWAVIMLTRIDYPANWWYILFAGCSLGAFAATKFPLFAPILIVSSAAMLWRSDHRKELLPLVMYAGITFVASYAVYFIQGHSLLEWVRSLYWTFKFYQAGVKEHLYFQLFPAFFLGKYNTSVQSTAHIVDEWTFWWPCMLIGSITAPFVAWWKKKIAPALWYLWSICILFVCALSIVEFQARYVFLLIPLMTVLAVVTIPLKKWLWSILITVFFIQGLFALRTQPTVTVVESQRMWQYAHYQDLYSFLTPDTVQVDRRTFHEILTRQLQQNLGVKSQQISIVVPTVTPWEQLFADTISAQVVMRLNTEFGPYERIHPLTLRRIENQWYINWDWSIYTPEFGPQCTLSYQIDASQGKLISSDGVILSQYAPVSYARFDLSHVQTTPTTFSALAELLGIEDLQAENIIQNTANGRLWLDLPIRYDKVPANNPLASSIVPHPLYRRVSTHGLSEAGLDHVAQLEEQNPVLSAPPSAELVTTCGDKVTVQHSEGSRANVKVSAKQNAFR